MPLRKALLEAGALALRRENGEALPVKRRRPLARLQPRAPDVADAPTVALEAELPPSTAIGLAIEAMLTAWEPKRSKAFTVERRQLMRGPHFTDHFRVLPANRLATPEGVAAIAQLLDYDPKSEEFKHQRKEGWRDKAWGLITKGCRHVGAQVPDKASMKARLRFHDERKETENVASLPYAQLPAWFAQCAGDNEQPELSRLTRFIVLTACRRDEARLATWEEFDLDDSVWHMPGARTKTGRPLDVPLSREAKRLLGKPGKRGAYAFTLKQDQEIGKTTLNGYVNIPHVMTLHGFRTTFVNYCRSQKVPQDVYDASLGHAPVTGKTQKAYDRGYRFEERVPVMAQWAKFCVGAKS
jgi:integrase